MLEAYKLFEGEIKFNYSPHANGWREEQYLSRALKVCPPSPAAAAPWETH